MRLEKCLMKSERERAPEYKPFFEGKKKGQGGFIPQETRQVICCSILA